MLYRDHRLGLADGPDGKPLAGRSPLGVSHWLPISSFDLESWQPYFSAASSSTQNHCSVLYVLSTYNYECRSVKLAHEMDSHDGPPSCETFCKQ
jgi:hypothetical protein